MVRVATAAKFPTTLAALADIGLFTNDEAAVITLNANAVATSFDVDDASGYAVGMWLVARSISGLEVVRVTAVDLGLNRVTIARAQDGTVAVAHVAGEDTEATIPAVALNQMRDEIIAIETFLGANGACVHWDRGLELEPSTDTCAILTLNLRSARTNKKFIQFSVDDVETGAMLYDSANDAIEFQNIRIDIGTGSDILLEDNRLIRLGTDSDAQLAFDSADNRVEWRSDVITRFQAVAGTELVSIDPTVPALISNVVVRARTDNATDLGTAAVRWRGLYLGPSSLHVLAAASDANDILHAGSAGFQMGAGGASALDVTLVRQAASIYKVTGNLAGDVRFGMSGAATPFLALRAATADAQPLVAILTDRLALGAGGATVADYSLVRTGANTGTLSGTLRPSVDNTYDVGSSLLRLNAVISNRFKVYGGPGDANAMTEISTTGLYMGAGGAGALDTFFNRRGDSYWDISGNLAGNLRLGMTGAGVPTIEVRVAGGNAQPDVILLKDRISFGAGGITAVDYSLIRTGANTGTISGTLRPSADNTYNLGAVAERWATGYFTAITATSIAAGHILPAADNTYDLGSAALRWRDVYAAGSSFRVITAQGDANPSARLGAGAVHFGAGGATATSVQLGYGAADRLDLASGDSFNIVLGTLQMSGDTVFASDKCFAINLIPTADNTLDLGSATRRLNEAYLTDLLIHGAAGDANAKIRLSGSGLAFGAGGASATDIQFARQAASIVELTGSLAGSVRHGMSGAANAFISLRAAAADANAYVVLDNTGLNFGAGGASAPDTILYRLAASVLATNDNFLVKAPSGTFQDSIFIVDTGDVGQKSLFQFKENNVVKASIIHYNSAYGGSLDNILELNNAVAAPINVVIASVTVGTFTSAGQLTAPVVGSGAGLVLGGDWQVYRAAANLGQLAASDHLQIPSGDLRLDDATKGIILKDTQGTPHYWRVKISTLGVLMTTDLGTSLPAT